jgi:hypothetical protein
MDYPARKHMWQRAATEKILVYSCVWRVKLTLFFKIYSTGYRPAPIQGSRIFLLIQVKYLPFANRTQRGSRQQSDCDHPPLPK